MANGWRRAEEHEQNGKIREQGQSQKDFSGELWIYLSHSGTSHAVQGSVDVVQEKI